MGIGIETASLAARDRWPLLLPRDPQKFGLDSSPLTTLIYPNIPDLVAWMIGKIRSHYLAKLQRKRQRLGDESRETIEGALGMGLTEAIAHLRSQPPEVAATWLQ